MRTQSAEVNEIITINLPLKPSRRAGRKYLIAPNGATVPATAPNKQRTAMQEALGRAFLWRRELETGDYEGITDFSRKKKLHESYTQRMLLLTLLAPSIVEAILEDSLPRYLKLTDLYALARVPLWTEQEKAVFRKAVSCVE